MRRCWRRSRSLGGCQRRASMGRSLGERGLGLRDLCLVRRGQGISSSGNRGLGGKGRALLWLGGSVGKGSEVRVPYPKYLRKLDVSRSRHLKRYPEVAE